jgi:hypothetical protein
MSVRAWQAKCTEFFKTLEVTNVAHWYSLNGTLHEALQKKQEEWIGLYVTWQSAIEEILINIVNVKQRSCYQAFAMIFLFLSRDIEILEGIGDLRYPSSCECSWHDPFQMLIQQTKDEPRTNHPEFNVSFIQEFEQFAKDPHFFDESEADIREKGKEIFAHKPAHEPDMKKETNIAETKLQNERFAILARMACQRFKDHGFFDLLLKRDVDIYVQAFVSLQITLRTRVLFLEETDYHALKLGEVLNLKLLAIETELKHCGDDPITEIHYPPSFVSLRQGPLVRCEIQIEEQSKVFTWLNTEVVMALFGNINRDLKEGLKPFLN